VSSSAPTSAVKAGVGQPPPPWPKQLIAGQYRVGAVTASGQVGVQPGRPVHGPLPVNGHSAKEESVKSTFPGLIPELLTW